MWSFAYIYLCNQDQWLHSNELGYTTHTVTGCKVQSVLLHRMRVVCLQTQHWVQQRIRRSLTYFWFIIQDPDTEVRQTDSREEHCRFFSTVGPITICGIHCNPHEHNVTSQGHSVPIIQHFNYFFALNSVHFTNYSRNQIEQNVQYFQALCISHSYNIDCVTKMVYILSMIFCIVQC